MMGNSVNKIPDQEDLDIEAFKIQMDAQSDKE